MADYFRKVFKLPCEDHETRAVRVRCYTYNGGMAADTFFSVPADVRIAGQFLTGFVRTDDVSGLRFVLHDRAIVKLRASHGAEYANRFRVHTPNPCPLVR